MFRLYLAILFPSNLNCITKRCQRDGLGRQEFGGPVGFEDSEGHPLVCFVAHSGVNLPPRMADRNLCLHLELHLPYAVTDRAN